VRTPADELERRAATIPAGTSKERVRQLLGEPINASQLTDGGETWLYIEADPERDQRESLSAEFDASGGFKRLRRKPLD
jgi:outer membrane protein assembly factor BamE (lipoprotein component of BamABCDE complex)